MADELNVRTRAKNPVLPKKGERNILITSALPYVNNVPHLGNIIGSTLSADAFSRYCKLRGYNALYVCGTDEYGTATETKAYEEGVTPEEICSKYFKIHKQVYEWFDIKFDKFGRTSTPEQTKIAQDIFLKLNDKGYLYPQTIQQWYWEKGERFLADRFVEGTCPDCGYDGARGDQCDKCGHLLNAIDLINPKCKIDGSTPVLRSTEHIFLNLTKIQDQLEEWINVAAVKGEWAANALNVTRAWIKKGLEPRCITRDLKWGTPVPLEQFKDKVFYVWFDAPIGYISITATYTDDWEKWWKNSNDDVKLYQFMGKDNIPFHTVIFPSSLIAGEDNWNLLHHINTTEYLNYEGGKFSKSRNIGVFGTDAISSGLPSEIWRFYLFAIRPETSDSSFSWDDLAEKNNNELLANLGNFVNRALSITSKSFDGTVPAPGEFTEVDKQLIDGVNQQLGLYIQAMEKVQLREGLRIAFNISRLGNKYIQDTEPWVLQKSDRQRCATILYISVNIIKLLSAILEPYTPGLTAKILTQLKCEQDGIPDKFEFKIPAGHKIGTPEPLVRKLDPKDIAGFKQKYGVHEKPVKSDAFPVDIRGGVIASVDDHPLDENLYVVQVDLGSEKRQVVGRLKSAYKKEDLLGTNVLVLCNLPVAELKGTKSEGMLLVADGKKGKESIQRLLQPQGDVPSWAGSKIIAEGSELEVKPDISLKEFQKLDLKLTKEGVVVFKQKHPLKVQGTEVGITAKGVEGPAKIK